MSPYPLVESFEDREDREWKEILENMYRKTVLDNLRRI